MKKLSLVLTLASLALPQAGRAGWWRTYGDENHQIGNCVQVTSDGNYVISGRDNLFLRLLKVDTLGNVIWSHNYGRSEGMITRWIEETSDGEYIVAPRTPSLLKVDAQGDSLWGRNYGVYSYCVQVTQDGGYVVIGGPNGYKYEEQLDIVKTDPEGNALWVHTYAESGNNWNFGYFIQGTDDGGYIIFGLTGYIDPDYNEWSKVWLVKIDSEGNKLWSKAYGREEYGYTSKAYCGRQTSDGGYIITGVSSVGLWLLKTDSLGDTLWTKTYNTATGGTGFSVQLTKDGGYIITGVTENFYSAFNTQSAQLWLLKTDEEGDTTWTRLYYGDGYDVGRCVQQTKDSGYIVVGYTSSHGAGGSDIYLLRTDSLGLLSIKEEPILQKAEDWGINSIGSELTLNYENRPQGFRASIFDCSGRKVDELNSTNPSGTIHWGSTQPSGVYFLRVAGKTSSRVERVILVH